LLGAPPPTAPRSSSSSTSRGCRASLLIAQRSKAPPICLLLLWRLLVRGVVLDAVVSTAARDEKKLGHRNSGGQAEATVAVELYFIAPSHVPNVDTSPSCSSPFAGCLYGCRRTSRSLGDAILGSWLSPVV
jgi:hypothetical protein